MSRVDASGVTWTWLLRSDCLPCAEEEQGDPGRGCLQGSRPLCGAGQLEGLASGGLPCVSNTNKRRAHVSPPRSNATKRSTLRDPPRTLARTANVGRAT
eukprot:4882247-Pyramimonas_sp.AAC.1